MTPSKNIIVAESNLLVGARRPLHTDYNHQMNFIVVLILIEVLSVVLMVFI